MVSKWTPLQSINVKDESNRVFKTEFALAGQNLMNFKVNSRKFGNNALGEGGLTMKLVTSKYVRVGQSNIQKDECITLAFVIF